MLRTLIEANLGCMGLYLSFFDCGAGTDVSNRSGWAAIFSPAPCGTTGSGATTFFLLGPAVGYTTYQMGEFFSRRPDCTKYGLALAANLL